MSEKILFVDDEPNVLDGIRRQLRKTFTLDTACGPEEGLARIRASGPYAVIVSDMKMPGMNGAQFLAQARMICPESVRMILSGQSELDSAIAAVNDGNIFRFLTKPCAAEVLVQGIEAGVTQYRLVIAEREVLEKTLDGAVTILTEVLSLVDPESFARTHRIRNYSESISEQMHLGSRWQVRLGALVSQLGCISLPPEVLQKAYSQEPMSDKEREMFLSHPKVAASLLVNIPRLGPVAEMVSKELAPLDLSELPNDAAQWDVEMLGAQILRASIEFDRRITLGDTKQEALRQLRKLPGGLTPEVIKALESLEVQQEEMTVSSLGLAELRVRMILDQDVTTHDGRLLVKQGQEVNEAMLARLRNFLEQGIVGEPVRALVPRHLNIEKRSKALATVQ